MRWLYRLVSWLLGWPLLAVVSLVASVLYHIDTDVGRKLARDMLNEFVSGEMVGSMHAGYIVQLRLWHTIVKDTFVYDPDGNAIIYGETVDLGIDPIAALRGRLRFYYAHLTNGWVDLIDDGKGAPTFLAAFEAADQTPTQGEPFHAIVDNMDVRNIDVTGELLGLKNLRVADLHAKGRMEFYEITDIEIWSATGRIVEPFPFEAAIDNIVGSVHTDERGTQVTAEASRGDEHLTAEIVYRPREGSKPEEPYDLDLFLRVEPVSAQTLRDVGFSWAQSLKGDANGWIRMWGPEGEYQLRADVDTAGGRARIKGVLPSEGVTRIEIAATDAMIGAVINGAPDIEVSGKLEITSEPNQGDVLGVAVDTEGFDYENIRVPPFVAKTRVRTDGIDILSLKTVYAGGDLSLDGHVEYSGVIEIHARGQIPDVGADPNFQRYAEGMRGGAKFDLNIRKTMSGDFETKGSTEFDNFDYGAISARSLRLAGRVWGDPARPLLDLRLDGTAVRVAGYPVGNGAAVVTGGPTEYTATGNFEAQGDRRAEFRARVQANGEVYRLDVDTVELAVGDLSWKGFVENATLNVEKGLSFDRILMGRGLQRLEAKGTWLFDGPDDIVADLQNFDLAVLRILYPEEAPDFKGKVDLHFEFRGDLEKKPTIVAEGTLTEATLWEIAPVNAAYLIHYDKGVLDADAQVDLAGRGNFTLSSTGFVEPAPGGVGAALREGVYEATLSTRAMDLTLLELILGEDWARIEGYADAKIGFSGSIDAPSFKGQLEVPALTVEGWGPIRLGSNFRYEYGALLAQVRLDDDGGELFESEGSVLVNLANLVRNPTETIEALETSPWRVSMRIPPRSLSAFPRKIGEKFFADATRLQLAASLTVAGGAFRTRGDLFASVDWLSGETESLCGSGANPRATIRATLADDVTTLTMDGVVGDAEVLDIQASAETPIEEWLRAAEIPKWPITSISADFYQAPTENLPYLCRYAAGVLTARLRGTGLFGDEPKLSFSLSSDDLRARRLQPARRAGLINSIVETPPAQTRISASYQDGLGDVDARIDWWNGGSTILAAKMPLKWDRDHPIPILGEKGELDGKADFDRMPLQALFAWMTGALNVEGILEGSVSAQGPVQDPRFVGSVDISDGRLDLRTVGQTLEDVKGRVIFDEDGMTVSNLEATDQGGSAKLSGRVTFKGFKLGTTDLTVDTKGFPLRQEGSIIARMTGNARLMAKFEEHALEGDVRLKNLELDIPGQSATPIGLSPHPDVHFVGETKEPPAPVSPYRVELAIASTNKVIIRSREQGFYVEASADLNTTVEKELLVKGTVTLQRGNFKVFGKRFDIRSGSMIFDNEPDMDARVELVARHSLRGSNDTVTVTASGRLSNPKIEFSSSIPTTSQGQIVALLLTGSTSQERGLNTSTAQASNDTSSFLSGVAAGLVSASLQSQFGGLAPTIGIQQGQATSDEYESNTAVQIGFNVDSILPENIPIRGLYVEGQFVARRTEGGPNTTGQAQRPGFLIEALWPLSFVTTATFQPPSNWSLDVSWEP